MRARATRIYNKENPRHKEAWVMRSNNATYETIGAHMNVSGARARQMVELYDNWRKRQIAIVGPMTVTMTATLTLKVSCTTEQEAGVRNFLAASFSGKVAVTPMTVLEHRGTPLEAKLSDLKFETIGLTQ